MDSSTIAKFAAHSDIDASCGSELYDGGTDHMDVNVLLDAARSANLDAGWLSIQERARLALDPTNPEMKYRIMLVARLRLFLDGYRRVYAEE